MHHRGGFEGYHYQLNNENNNDLKNDDKSIPKF
jgi:hypothetical protein